MSDAPDPYYFTMPAASRLSPWLAELAGLIDGVESLAALVELTLAPETTRALSHPACTEACDMVKAACDGREDLVLAVPVLFEAKFSRQDERLLVVTSEAIYRVERSGADIGERICARVPLSEVVSVEGAACGWVVATSNCDPEGESIFAALWKDYVAPPRGARFERTYWIETDGIDPKVVNEWSSQVIVVCCAALRAAVRLGCQGEAERVAGLRGQKRWLEGGGSVELQSTAQAGAMEVA